MLEVLDVRGYKVVIESAKGRLEIAVSEFNLTLHSYPRERQSATLRIKSREIESHSQALRWLAGESIHVAAFRSADIQVVWARGVVDGCSEEKDVVTMFLKDVSAGPAL